MFRAARHRIAGSDSGFLSIEGESQTSTCTHTLVLGAPPPGQGPLTREQLLAHLEGRLDRTPIMRRRLALVPGGIGHAVFVDDPHFDLDAHVLQARLPEPGGEAEFNHWMAGQVPLRLPRDRALWQVTLLDGMEGGRQALVFAFHHTLADGAGLLAILSELVEDRVRERPEIVDARRAGPAPAPPRAWLFVATLLRQLFVWMTFPVLVVRTSRRFRAVNERRETADVRVPPMSGGAPATVLNISADNERRYARTAVPLSTLRAVRAEAGTTVSDVVLAMVAGALRDHLGEQDQLPEEPLVVNVPVARDAADAAPRLGGNVFCNYYSLLATDEPDVRTRLSRTADYTAEAKHQLDLQGRDTLVTWLDRLPPALVAYGAQKVASGHRTGEQPPDFNLVLSNLKVPRADWSLRGQAVEEIIFSGPVSDGAGLNITIVGYGDQVIVTAQTNPSAMARPEDFVARLHDSLAELALAYGVESPRTHPGTNPADSKGQVA